MLRITTTRRSSRRRRSNARPPPCSWPTARPRQVPRVPLPRLGHAKWVNIRRARYKDFEDRPIRHILRGVNGSDGTSDPGGVPGRDCRSHVGGPVCDTQTDRLIGIAHGSSCPWAPASWPERDRFISSVSPPRPLASAHRRSIWSPLCSRCQEFCGYFFPGEGARQEPPSPAPRGVLYGPGARRPGLGPLGEAYQLVGARTHT